MPDVSIIIPTLNRRLLLRQAVRSALIQTFDDLEVIVVDDGSDEDIECEVNLLSRDAYTKTAIKYIRQPPMGANLARNRGLSVARGQFIQFLDSDDLLHPKKIEVQRQYLLQHGDCDMVFSLDEFFHEHIGDLGILWSVPDERDPLDRFLWDDPVWHTGSGLWRRSAVDRIGGWDERLCCWQDWEFHIRAICQSLHIDYIPIVFQYIRDHQGVRSTNLASTVLRAQSKLLAAANVATTLQTTGKVSPSREDALAVFAFTIIRELLPGARDDARRAARLAWNHAHSMCAKVCAFAFWSELTATRHLLNETARISTRLLERMKHLSLLPNWNSKWKCIKAPPYDLPNELTNAMKCHG